MAVKRDSSIDFLKIISMAAVLFLHTQRNAEEGVVFNYVLYYGARFAMPVFFMVNGMLIMNRKEFTFDYYKKKILNIIRITAIWGGISVILSLLFDRSGIKRAVVNGIKCLWGGYAVPFWFLVTLGIIYTILLFCFPIVKKKLNLILIVLGSICVVINLVSLINIFVFDGFYIQEPVNQRIRLWSWGFYFLLGYRLKDMTFSDKQKKYLPIMTTIVTVVAIVYQYLIFVVKLNKINSSFCYESPLIMLWAAMIFLTVRNSNWIRNTDKGAVIQKLSIYSFGIFLLHGYFLRYLDLVKANHNAISAFGVWLGLYSVCLVITIILSRIPYLNKIMKY